MPDLYSFVRMLIWDEPKHLYSSCNIFVADDTKMEQIPCPGAVL